MKIQYTASKTFQKFHRDTSFVRGVFGPVGGGKTVGALMEILYKAMRQTPDANGLRRTRFAVIRQSYPQLKSTVIKTFDDWIGGLGKMSFSSPITWKAKLRLSDGTVADMEVMFLALERPEDAAKLRSLELSHAVISEASEIPSSIMEMLKTRVGRFPSMKDGAGCKDPQIWLESNPPSINSHWYNLFEEVRPKGHKLFRQPSALLYDADTEEYSPNPEAENLKHLQGGYDYYFRQLPGQSQHFIDVYIMANYGDVYSGKRIYDMFDSRFHATPEVLRPTHRGQIVVGMDFGLSPAAVPTQLALNGAMHVFGEVVGEDIMFEQFVDEKFIPFMNQHLRGWPVMVVGDPSDNSGRACYSILHSRRIAAVPAVSNDPQVRWDAVKFFLSKTNGFLMTNEAGVLKRGFMGGYMYKQQRGQVLGSMHTGKADKNEMSHPHDALQYACLYHRAIPQHSKKSTRTRKPYLYA